MHVCVCVCVHCSMKNSKETEVTAGAEIADCIHFFHVLLCESYLNYNENTSFIKTNKSIELLGNIYQEICRATLKISSLIIIKVITNWTYTMGKLNINYFQNNLLI